MKCPHCLESFHGNPSTNWSTSDTEGVWGTSFVKCPSCNRLILYLDFWQVNRTNLNHNNAEKSFLIRPKGISRSPLPIEVPDEFANDYKEACLVIVDSPKASAALSRRCLQYILREKAKVKPSDLANEIQELIDSGNLPSYISAAIDAVRNIGNFAAHPIKSKSTGEIVPVEPGEAEWNLDVIEALFDFYLVQPAKIQSKKAALNAKLNDAGKPEMK